MNHSTLRLPAPLLGLLLLAPAAAAQLQAEAQSSPGVRYEKRGDLWFRSEGGFEYQVDPKAISLRFADRDTRAAEALARLGAEVPALAGLTVLRSNSLDIHDVRLPEGADPLAVVAALRATGLVEFAEEGTIGRFHVLPNDPSFMEQWNWHNTGQGTAVLDADVDAPEAWDIEDGDPSIVIAVIDSGADDTHPDLAASIWTNPGETLNCLDDDNNGFIDDIRGWDFVENDNDPKGNTGHGTAVASFPGAVANNGLDLAGLAGGAVDGAGCRIMNLQMSNAAVFASNVVDDAILYAADNGAHVITLSLGVGNGPSINAAIQYAHDVKGVFINCSTGNTGVRVEFPAAHPLVMAVGSTNKQDNVSGFSGRGPLIDIVAPGESVPALRLNGGIVGQTGTSFSSPTVAALAGLLLSQDPTLSPDAVRQLIQFTAEDIDLPGFDNNAGWGRINAEQALLASASFVPFLTSRYGTGLAGTGGTVPDIQVAHGTRPGIGSTTFALSVTGIPPQTSAYLGVAATQGATPFRGGTILIGLTNPSRAFLTNTGDGGFASQVLPIPNDPTLVGFPFYAQWLVVDPGAPQGWAFSQGLEVTIGS